MKKAESIIISVCTQWGNAAGGGHIMRCLRLVELLANAQNAESKSVEFEGAELESIESKNTEFERAESGRAESKNIASSAESKSLNSSDAKSTHTEFGRAICVRFYNASDANDNIAQKLTLNPAHAESLQNPPHTNSTQNLKRAKPTPNPLDSRIQRIAKDSRLDALFSALDWREADIFASIVADSTHIIFDSYDFPPRLIQSALDRHLPCLIFDDSAQIPTWAKNLHTTNAPLFLLNPALGAESKFQDFASLDSANTKPKDTEGTHFFIGAEYSLAPSIFRYNRTTTRAKIEHILITLGASETNEKIQTIKQILESARHTSPHDSHKNALESTKQDFTLAQNFHLHIADGALSPRELAALMRECDIAISAGGQTLYELALSALPTIILPIAPNQILQSLAFARTQGMMMANLDSSLLESIAALTPARRAQMSATLATLPIGSKAKELARFIG
ncbi:hypothetical protein BKN38_05425 [Helicobacter sp. CLO-3]|nr:MULTISPECIES: hypothetical protein [unclassified Helicobacter]OBV29050.1 hypothetical protein BA723_07165 [Helicobacter sp. CLO-3]OHU83332.1 hypothetical protein BKN38_05425 [Helicobacter sp. CLO-3]